MRAVLDNFLRFPAAIQAREPGHRLESADAAPGEAGRGVLVSISGAERVGLIDEESSGLRAPPTHSSP